MRTLPPVGGSHTPDPWVRALRGMPEYCTFGQLQDMLRRTCHSAGGVICDWCVCVPDMGLRPPAGLLPA